jgi:hypothetical protein
VSQIQASGGQPQKPPKYAPIYTGRFFNGLNTNRSPLRAASASHLYEKFYGDTSGDALIAGSNTEVSNRLTIIRRPGNPIYDTGHTGSTGYNDPYCFDEFRVNKASSDVFGTDLEAIYTMIDDTDYLYSLTSPVGGFQGNLVRGGDSGYYYGLKFPKNSGSGQSYMQSVGNSLYFANGVQNKKWLTSLFVRTSASNSATNSPVYLQGSDGLAGTYPFGSYLVDPNSGLLDQLIGINLQDPGTELTLSLTDDVLTVKITFDTTNPYGAGYQLSQQSVTAAFLPQGSTLQLYGLSSSTWKFLEGMVLTTLAGVSESTGTLTFTATVIHADVAMSSSFGYVLQTGTIGQLLTSNASTAGPAPIVAITGTNVPTWSTVQPQISNDFEGGLTQDGSTVWINRGGSIYTNGTPASTADGAVYNWGIQAPTEAPTFNLSSQEGAWAANTYYSPVSVFIDSAGNIWQVTTSGKSGGTQPNFSGSATTPVQKILINSIALSGTVLTATCVDPTTGGGVTALSVGDSLTFHDMSVFNSAGSFPALSQFGMEYSTSNVTVTVASVTNVSGKTVKFTANYTSSVVGQTYEHGYAWKTNAASTVSDGTVVWTYMQSAASTKWAAATHYNGGDFIVNTAGGKACLFQLAPLLQPFVVTQFPTGITGSTNMGGAGATGGNLWWISDVNGQNSVQGAFEYFEAPQGTDPQQGTYPTWSKSASTNSKLPGLIFGREGLPWASSNTPNSLGASGIPGYPTSTSNQTGNQAGPYATVASNGAGSQGSVSLVTPEPMGPQGANQYAGWVGCVTAYVFIPQAGNYTFNLVAQDGSFFSFDSNQTDSLTIATGAKGVLGTQITAPNEGPNSAPHSVTAQVSLGSVGQTPSATSNNIQGYNNSPGQHNGQTNATSTTWTFPQAGLYALEIDYAKWNYAYGIMQFWGYSANSTVTPKGSLFAMGYDVSGANSAPTTAWTTSQAAFKNNIVVYPSSVDDQSAAGVYQWNNVGPTTDYNAWHALTPYTLPNQIIIDTNGNMEAPYETGVSGTTHPTWKSAVGATTADKPNLVWINEGSGTSAEAPVTTFSAAVGYYYWIALVNTLDNTVSNVSPVSANTGVFTNGYIEFQAGSGLDLATVDPQADYVAIFRSTDGFTTPILIPGYGNSPWTTPLVSYLKFGYTDTTVDAALNTLITGAQAGENTPPAIGAVNLTYHLQRIWYSLGNTVYWTTGPLAPCGNGTDGTSPLDFASCPSKVQRLVPTAIGMLVFTVSDVYIIAGNGTLMSPILPAIPYLTGVGLGNYNALDVNGGLIGFYTTDRQFVIFDPSAGLQYVGFPIGNLLRLNNGLPGSSWTPSAAYVAWYINGEDAGWYIADGQNGWYRVINTPAPEAGSVTWSTFALLEGTTGNCGAIANIEVSPGQHQLLIGQPFDSSNIMARDIDATTDNGTTESNGTTYAAYAVIGSIILSNPGQVAKIAFVTTESVRTGSPLVLGVILDEALPYYQGSFDILKHWVPDPPDLPESQSIWAQRFYLAEDEDTTAYCRHLQILVQWPAENAQNELQTMTVFGAYEVEQ